MTRATAAVRERLPFNSDFRFFRGDASGVGDSLSYAALEPWLDATGTDLLSDGYAKPVRPPGNPGAHVDFVAPEFDDSNWRQVELPHDYAIEGPFAQELPGETGKLPWQGVAWYRKRFHVPATDQGRTLTLEVDGAMSFSSFWLNGQFVGGWPYGYTSFRLDLTPYLRFGEENVLAVRLDNPPNSSRWYPGAGLYRNVWLEKTGAVRVAPRSVFVSTPRVNTKRAILNADVTVENTTAAELEITLETHFHELGADGSASQAPVVSAPSYTFTLAAGTQTLRTFCAKLKKPKLWSLAKRTRYVAVATLSSKERLLDRVETRFGVRSVRADERGFFLNDERVPLQGVCMHHDLGALGAAAHSRGIARQLEILQEMGCNAIRTSHNPPAPELLDLCDELGLLVMVEAFDCWRRGKKHPEGLKPEDAGFRYFDYASVFDRWHERDLRAMLRRDRNHPSVVMWSIGNEVIEQWYADGWKLSTHLAGIVREEDRTRPITSGFNGEIAGYSGFQTAVDVVGYNYKPKAYAALREHNPSIAILGSETASTISTRGEYFFPVKDEKSHGQVNFQVSSYDLSTPPWALTPDEEFRGLDECPDAAGEFVWTGFDYLGEPTPYNSDSTNLLNFSDPKARAELALELERLGKITVPSRSSYFGIIDLAGFPKDRFYLYQSRWRPELKRAHILPHWNFPERVGEVTPVHVYSAADSAELFLNGKSQGKRKRKRLEYRFRWDDVRYEPGELRVVTTKGGKTWATALRRTTGPANRLTLEADRTSLAADGRDLCFVTVSVTDTEGQLVPRSHPELTFSVRGPADILAVDNGDPTSLEPFQATTRRAFNGLALVVLKTHPNTPGPITLTVESAGLRSASTSVASLALARRP